MPRKSSKVIQNSSPTLMSSIPKENNPDLLDLKHIFSLYVTMIQYSYRSCIVDRLVCYCNIEYRNLSLRSSPKSQKIPNCTSTPPPVNTSWACRRTDYGCISACRAEHPLKTHVRLQPKSVQSNTCTCQLHKKVEHVGNCCSEVTLRSKQTFLRDVSLGLV